MADVLIEKTLSNTHEQCVPQNFRVEGTCKTPPAGCNDSCGDNKQTFIQYIYACNPYEVCEKFTASGNTGTIKSISIVDQSGCLQDVTPDFSDPEECFECCEHLLDENAVVSAEAVFTASIVEEAEVEGFLDVLGSFSSSYEVNGGGTYFTSGSGEIVLSGSFDYSASDYDFVSSGEIVLSSSFDSGVTQYNYVGSGEVILESLSTVSYEADLSGEIVLDGSFQATQIYLASGLFLLSGDFGVISSDYSYEMEGTIDVTSGFLSSNLGTVEFVDDIEMEVILDQVEFSFDDADVLVFGNESIVVCDTSLLKVLEVKHNFNELISLSRYLKRYDFVFDEIVEIHYNERLSAWTGNFHFDDWNFLFELECGTEWKFSCLIKYSGSIVRLVTIFDSLTFAPDFDFGSFDFDFDFRNNISDPLSEQSVFYDESGLFSAFLGNLKFEIRSGDVRDGQLNQQDLDKQQKAVLV